MAIVAGDLATRLTIKTGAAGDAAAQPDPNQSLGKYASQTALTDNTLHNLFDVVSGDENAAAESEYRALAVLNNHATLVYQAPKLWLSSEVAGGASLTMAVDNIAASAKGGAGAQLAEIANEDTAPSGVGAFSAPTTKATGLALGDIPALNVKGIWFKRTTANNAAIDNDGGTFNIEGDTAA